MAVEFLARLTEAGIVVMIVDTRRTETEHEQNLANGTSWTRRSKHLTGDAIDVCPFSTWDLHGADKLQWDAGDPIWARIVAIGEAVGFKAGARWKQKDMGHFEVPS